jgi:1-acyl-sn-glycerol-3-phosphate acyltransferase
MTSLRSFVFNVLFYATLIVLMILGLPSVLMGRHAVFFMGRLWGACSLWLLKNICGLTIEFRGLENIPKGGYIIAAKHQSFLETFSLLKHAPDFAYILKHELMYIPFFGWYLWGAEQIGIDRARGRNALSVLNERAAAVLRAGRQIFIFPEGTRRPPAAPPQYKFGVAYLYADSGAPCLPVALNTGLYWGRRGFQRRPGVAIIEYLPPIAPGLDREAFLNKLQDAIESACARLNAEAVAGDSSLALKLAPAQS